MSTIIDKAAYFFSGLSQSLASIVKIFLFSRRPFVADKSREKSIIILGNGPSLNETIENHSDFIAQNDCMAVNFAANTSMFQSIKPLFYILADPHFFIENSIDKNVDMLWQNLSDADWKMQLLIPVKYRRNHRIIKLKNSPNLELKFYNLTPVEGFVWLRNLVYSIGLGMPRPRNIMIPAIMNVIRLGYKTINLAGADHSWTKSLWVDDKNHVISIQPHFYKDNDDEKKRVATEYLKYPLYKILESLHIAFRAYFLIADYAKCKNIKIFNVTPDSFIDAFPRKKL